MYLFLYVLTSVNSRPSRKKLLDHVVPYVSSHWYVLGVKLLRAGHESHLDYVNLNDVKDNQMCCMEMFSYWLTNTVDATWKHLIEALRSPAIDLHHVAAKIEKMLIGS